MKYIWYSSQKSKYPLCNWIFADLMHMNSNEIQEKILVTIVSDRSRYQVEDKYQLNIIDCGIFLF